MTNLVDIEGIAEGYASKLHEAGVKNIEDLLAQGATPAGRAKIEADSGIAHAHILKWVNHADLFRIHGVAGQHAELLEASGVDTVVELSKRNAEHLAAKLHEVNETKHLVRHVPGEAEVEKWIAEAKALPRAVSY